jgi:hypothetical protein
MQRRKVTHYQMLDGLRMLQQQLQARGAMLDLIEDLKLRGYKLNEATGHWEHPNGDQAWVEG